MKYLLDTNACIRYLNARSERLRQRLDGTPPEDVNVCSIVEAELFFGAAKSVWPEKTLRTQRVFLEKFRSVPFDTDAALQYGQIRADLERRGTPVGANDLLIASIALANGLTLVTHNMQEFAAVRGLSVEDWESD
jgi:tRNA(fMet)-specific endonuclease VapC